MENRKILKSFCNVLIDPNYRFRFLSKFGFYNGMEDVIFIKKSFKAFMGKELNLDNPQTFNEKLQWIKLYARKPEYTIMVDKYKVREYIAKELGEEYLIPLLGVWDSPKDIDFDTLPNRFVLKCNHNSGIGMFICTDKSKLDIPNVRRNLQKGMNQNYYLTGREWPYKDVPRKIIAEKYMEDNYSGGLTDYKFFCYDGYVDCVMVCTDRASGDTKFYFFDREWNLLRYNIRGKNAPEHFTLPKPNCVEQMFLIAGRLSKGIPFVRVDLYECDGRIYFGEMTFFPQSGLDPNLLPETDLYFGNLIKLADKRSINYE